ncbi:glycosyltransferase [Akkermansiaceae bacterium]|nr:glycosyltransferase [Akkermansiaceae bacterium]MDB4695331.1 glycosyltransferase [Akkermansiaceae bacterium]
MKTVSIIMPVYNKENHVEKAIDSVLRQTFTDFELIIIDDGSTDKSSAICDKFAHMDSRIQVKHIPNGGVSHARNIALDLAEGDYIVFIDADDYVDEKFLESLVNAMQSSHADLVFSGFVKTYDKQFGATSFVPPYSGLVQFDDVIKEFTELQLQSTFYSFSHGKLYKRSLIEEHSIRFDEAIRLAEDFEFNTQVYSRISTIYFLPESNYHYIIDAENNSQEMDSYKIDYYTQLMIWLKVARMLEMRNAFRGNNETLVKQSVADYVIFTLFFNRLDNYAAYVELFSKLQKHEIQQYAESKKERKLFFILHRCYTNGYCRSSWIYIKLYRILRSLKHGGTI